MSALKFLFSLYRKWMTPLLTCAILTGSDWGHVPRALLGGALVFFLSEFVGRVFTVTGTFVSELSSIAQGLVIFAFLFVVFHLGLADVPVLLAAECAAVVAVGWLL
jgi:hypothetical protein